MMKIEEMGSVAAECCPSLDAGLVSEGTLQQRSSLSGVSASSTISIVSGISITSGISFALVT